jgi:hypothetical protein
MAIQDYTTMTDKELRDVHNAIMAGQYPGDESDVEDEMKRRYINSNERSQHEQSI